MEFRKKSDYSVLNVIIILFIISAIIRIILSNFVATPDVFYDELLYNKVARSIHDNLNCDFRSQGIVFRNILYPFIISPAFIFKDPNIIYFAIKCIGSILMSSSIFPVYILSKKILNNNKKVILICIIAIIIPDMYYSTKIMSEVLYYPLFIWCFLLIYNVLYSKNNKIRYSFLLGINFYLVYFCKEVGLCLIVSYILFYLYVIINKIRTKENCKIHINSMIIVVCTFIVLYILNLVLYNYFNDVPISNSKSFYSSLINKRINLNFIINYFYGTYIYFYYIIIGFFIFPLIIPLLNWKQKLDQFTMYTYISFILYVLVIIFTIYMNEDVGKLNPRIHIRYVFPYFIIFILMTVNKIEDNILLNKRIISILCILILSLFFIDINVNPAVFTDAPMLSFLYVIKNNMPTSYINMIIIYKIFILLFISLFLYHIYHLNNIKNFKKSFLWYLMLILVVNNVVLYARDIKAYNSMNDLKSQCIKINKYFSKNKGNEIVMMPFNTFDKTFWELESFFNHNYYFISIESYKEKFYNDGFIDLNNTKLDAYFAGSFNKTQISKPNYIITNKTNYINIKNVESINIEGVKNFNVYKVNNSKINVDRITNGISEDNWVNADINANIKIFNNNLHDINVKVLISTEGNPYKMNINCTSGMNENTNIPIDSNVTKWVTLKVKRDLSKNYFELNFKSDKYFVPNETLKNGDLRKLSFRILDFKY